MDFLPKKTFLVQLLANKQLYTVTLGAGCYGVSTGNGLALQEVSKMQGIKVLNNPDEVFRYKEQYLMFF